MVSGNNNNNNINRICKNRKRKVIWFSPPFCKLSPINIGKYFLNLIDKHFHKENPLSRIFCRNTIKISCSCMNDIFKIIYNCDWKIVDKSHMDYKRTRITCNCRNKEECP